LARCVACAGILAVVTTQESSAFAVDAPPDPVVVRGSMFFLRDTLTSGTATTSFSFGQPNDYPVFGDWDGDGTTTVAWAMAISGPCGTATGAADVTFSYELPSDIPVVGDWDGDGDTTSGVVRGDTWYLRNSKTSGTADVALGLGSRAD
jgi:hypothetical protein